MKQITNKTILQQEGKQFTPAEVDGVVYWTDKEAIPKSGDYIQFPPQLVSKYALKPPKDASVIVAQSQPKLEGVPAVNMNSYIEQEITKKALNMLVGTLDKMGYDSKAIDKMVQDNSFYYLAGFKANPSRYTKEDMERAIKMAETSGRVDMGYCVGDIYSLSEHNECVKTTEEIIEQINSISLIEVDDKFQVIKYR